MVPVMFMPVQTEAFHYVLQRLKSMPWTPDYSYLTFKNEDFVDKSPKTIVLRDGDSLEEIAAGYREVIFSIHGQEINNNLVRERTLVKRMEPKGYLLSKGYLYYNLNTCHIELSVTEKDEYAKHEGMYVLQTSKWNGKAENPDAEREGFMKKEADALKSWITEISDVVRRNIKMNIDSSYTSIFSRIKRKSSRYQAPNLNNDNSQQTDKKN